MSKKLNLVTKAMSIMIMVALFFGMSLTAFAAPLEAVDEDNPVDAQVGKLLTMPEGVATPNNMKFTFEFEKVSLDGETSLVGQMPTILDKDVTFQAASVSHDSDDMKKVYLETAPIFGTGTAWPHAGVYKYTVEEKENTYTISDPTKEELTYSKAQYEITVFVANKSGTGGNLYIKGIVIKILKNDAGTAVTNNKVTVEPGDPDVDGEYTGMLFTNNYSARPGGGDPTTTYALAIKHEVSNPYADQTKYFAYSVTATKPASVTSATTYRIYVVQNGSVVTSAANTAATIKTDATYGPYFEVASGTQFTVNLKHGQWLSFNDLHTGATYTATAPATVDYKHSYVKMVNGTAQGSITEAEGNALTVPVTQITAGIDRADFTSKYKDISVTGISLEDMPFILLLVFAGLGLGLYGVAKTRKRARQNV
jgi:hypothetical protein